MSEPSTAQTSTGVSEQNDATKHKGFSGRVSVGHPVDVATGKLFDDFEDHVINGRVPLPFERHYSSELVDQTDSIFGRGWVSPFDAKIKRDLDGFRMLDTDGETEVTFDDPEDALASGGVLRNLGGFAELTLDGKELCITRWEFDTNDVKHYRFDVPEFGQWASLKSVTDPTGQGHDIHRNDQGRVTKVSQRREPRGYLLRYNKEGRVKEARAYYPHVFKDDETGKDRFKEQSHIALSFDYDEHGRLCRVTDALNQSSFYEYDEEHYLVKETNICGVVYKFTYDEQRRCVQTTGPNKFGCNDLEFDPSGKVTWVTNSAGEKTTYVVNDDGQVEKEIDCLGHAKQTEFDDHGRIVTQIDQLGRRTEYGYDEAGNRNKVIYPDGTSNHLEFNSAHLPVSVVDAAGNQWRREHTDNNHVAKLIDPLDGVIKYRYNRHGDLTDVLDQNQARTRYQWNALGDLGQMTDPLGHSTHYQYSKQGDLKTITDAKGVSTTAKLDKLGRIQEVRLPDGARRKYSWTAVGNIQAFTDEIGNKTTWKYGTCDFPSVIVRPHGGRIRFDWSGVPGRLRKVRNEKKEEYLFDYDDGGRLIKETDFSGRETHYEYNEANQVIASIDNAKRRTEIQRDDMDRILSIAYADGAVTSLEYDPRGLLTFADNGQVPVTRQFDELGRLTKEIQGEHEVVSHYDATGNRTRRESSMGVPTDFFWDGNYQLTKLQHQGHKALEFEYDEVQNEVRRFIDGGFSIDQKFDARGRKTEQRAVTDKFASNGRVAVGGGEVVRRQYAYDDASNLTKLSDKNWGVTNYTYDSVQRIIDANRVGEFSEQFEYDQADNIISSVAKSNKDSQSMAGHSESSVIERGNMLTKRGDIEYVYDDVGQLIKKIDPKEGETAYHWNHLGQMIGVDLPNGDHWDYTYDAFSRRTRKSGPNQSTEFVWDGDVILHERSFSESDQAHHAQWEFQPYDFAPIGKLEKDQSYHCVNDIAGNPREIVSDDGQLQWSNSISLWGKELETTVENVDCPIRHQGQWYDDETGLAYNRHRYFNFEIAQFICLDPIGIFGGLNLALGALNPISYSDPRGLTQKGCAKTLAANKAQGAAGEAITEANLGQQGVLAGKQVTFVTSTGKRTRIDFVVNQKGGKGVVETKTGNAKLTSGQRQLLDDINNGRPVIPKGKRAVSAGLTPGQPIVLKSFSEDRPI